MLYRWCLALPVVTPRQQTHCTITRLCYSLLKEAQPLQEKRTVEMGEERIRGPHCDDEDGEDGEQGDDRKLLSRYGIWLLLKLCPVKEDVDVVSRSLG